MAKENHTVPKGKLVDIVSKINENIAALRNENRLISLYSPSLGAQIERLYQDAIEGMSNVLAIVLSDEKEAESVLSDTLDSLQKGRSRYLRDFLMEITPKARKRIQQSFWLKGQVSYLSELKKIEESFKKAERGKPKDTALLSTCLSEFDSLLSKIADEKKTTRFRAPLYTFLWGMPIWIGIVYSGKLGFWGILICLLLVVAIASFSFLVSNREIISLRRPKKRKSGPTSSLGPLRMVRIQKMRLFFLAFLLVLAVVAIVRNLGPDIVTLCTPNPVTIDVNSIDVGASMLQITVDIDPKSKVLYEVQFYVDCPIIRDQSPSGPAIVRDEKTPIRTVCGLHNGVPEGNYPATINVTYKLESPIKFWGPEYISKGKSLREMIIVQQEK